MQFGLLGVTASAWLVTVVGSNLFSSNKTPHNHLLQALSFNTPY